LLHVLTNRASLSVITESSVPLLLPFRDFCIVLDIMRSVRSLTLLFKQDTRIVTAFPPTRLVIHVPNPSDSSVAA